MWPRVFETEIGRALCAIWHGKDTSNVDEVAEEPDWLHLEEVRDVLEGDLEEVLTMHLF